MQTALSNSLATASFVLFVAPAVADEPSSKADGFGPYELVGEWQFLSSNSGKKYGVDIRIRVASIEKPGVMRGVISLRR